MATNIGPKIGIDGEAEYRKQINQIIQQAKTLDSEMRVVTSAFSAETSEQEKSAKTGKIVADQMKNQQERVRLLSDMLQKSAEKYGENDTKTLKWKEALNNATAELNSMQKEGKETAKATDDIGDAFEESGQKGLKFGDIIKANLISDAIKAGIKELANIAGKLAEGFKAAVQGSAEYADNIITMSQVTGIATDKLQAYQYMANLTDTSVETITGAMTKLTRNMNSARSGTKATAEAFGALGVEIQKSDGTLRDNDEVFGEIIDKLGAMEEGAERDAIAMQIFGKSAQDLNPLIKQGSEGIAELTKEAEKVGAVLSEKDLATLGGIQDSFDRLAATGDALKNRLGVALGEIILPQLNEFADLVQLIAGGEITLEEAGERLGQILGELVEKAAEALPAFLSFGMEILENLAAGILAALPSVAAELPKVLVKLVEFILSALPKVLNAAAVIVVELAKGIAQALPELIPAAVDAVLKIADTLTNPDSLGEIIDSALLLIIGLADGLIAALPRIQDKAPVIIQNLTDAIVENAPKLLEAAAVLIVQLGVGIISNLPKAFENGVQMVTSVIGGILSLAADLRIKAIELIGRFLEGIRERFGDLKNMGTEVFNSIKNAITEKIAQGLKWGRDLIDNFTKGIKDRIAKVKEAAGNIANTIKKILGFSEPEEGPLSNFHTFAPDMIALWNAGIRENQKKLQKTIEKAFDFRPTIEGVTEQMDLNGISLPAAMPRALNASTTNMGGVTITVNGAPGQDVGQLADLVAVKIQNMVNRKEAVFA